MMSLGWRSGGGQCGRATHQGIASWKLIVPMKPRAIRRGSPRRIPPRNDRAIDFLMPEKTHVSVSMIDEPTREQPDFPDVGHSTKVRSSLCGLPIVKFSSDFSNSAGGR